MLQNNEESSGDFLKRVGTNGQKWAEEMHKRFPSVSTDDLLGWCCNMIEIGRSAGYSEGIKHNSEI